MIQRMKEKADQVQCELKADCDRERDKLIYRLVHGGKYRDIVRMDARSFLNLCFLLEEKGGLRPTRRVGIHELVARFLYTVGHNEKHRPLAFYWWRGRATVSRDFHKVMKAILELEQDFFIQPDGSRIPQEISGNEKFYPYFKDCVGAIEAPKYRGRKDFPTMNVLAACTFDLKFTYVLVGWEGTVSDSKMMRNTLTRRYPLKIPQGQYYLVDAGFMIKSGLIIPFRGERYHLKEHSTRNPPQTSHELFNLRHASLQNAIERAFDVLKKRFPIIRSTTEPHYSADSLKKIVSVCCILHNFLVYKDVDINMLVEVNVEIEYRVPDQPERPTNRDEERDSRRGEALREEMTLNMWTNYARR